MGGQHQEPRRAPLSVASPHLQRGQPGGQASAHRGQEIQIQRFDRVARPMVVRVSHVGRVRDHDGRIAEIPERGMIAAARVGNDTPFKGNREKLAGHGFTNLARKAPQVRQGSHVSD